MYGLIFKLLNCKYDLADIFYFSNTVNRVGFEHGTSHLYDSIKFNPLSARIFTVSRHSLLEDILLHKEA